jgi:hypothetical protein
MAELQKFEISDSRLEVRELHHPRHVPEDVICTKTSQHNNWKFPQTLKTRPLRKLDEEDFLVNHKARRASSLQDQCLTETLDRPKLRRQHCPLQITVRGRSIQMNVRG